MTQLFVTDKKNMKQANPGVVSKGQLGGEASEGVISVGPYGGKGVNSWSYVADSGDIRGITIGHGDVVDSLKFLAAGKISPRYGGTGGESNEIIFKDDEHIISISITYGDYYGATVILSLTIVTNLSKYGPFGERILGTTVKIPIEMRDVVGFFGYAGSFIDALGIYLKPKGGELTSSGGSAGPTS